MTEAAPRSHRQFARVEARYRGAVSPGWYRADLGGLAPFVSVPTWVYSTWAPFEVNLIGSASDEYVVLVDNTYVTSFAINMAKVELAAELFPGEHDYEVVMAGNIKKFLAEQLYILFRDLQSMRWVLEYLIEFNGTNRAIDARLRAHPQGSSLLQLVAECAAFLLLMHEVGHIAHSVGDFSLRERDVLRRHVDDVAGRNHRLRRLDEEVFCDVFALVNVVGLFNREKGWDPVGLCEVCLHVLHGALLCIKTRDVAKAGLEGGAKVGIDPTQDVLMARHEIASRVIRQVLGDEAGWFGRSRLPVPFRGDTLRLRERWVDAMRMGVLDAETRTISSILASAFADPSLGGFDFVMGSLNQIRPLSNSAAQPASGDVRR